MKYGHARVSTNERNPAFQPAALKETGCKTVFRDGSLLGATAKRPVLLCCLKKLEHGDTLIVSKLDRLGRSLRELIAMLDDLRARGVKFGRKVVSGRQKRALVFGRSFHVIDHMEFTGALACFELQPELFL